MLSSLKKFYTGPARGVLARVFYSTLKGADFEPSFSLMPGTYDVALGFVSTVSSKFGARILSFYVDGKIRLEAYDTFFVAYGCWSARVETPPRQIVDPLRLGPLRFAFATYPIRLLSLLLALRPVPTPVFRSQPVSTFYLTITLTQFPKYTHYVMRNRMLTRRNSVMLTL